MPLPRCHCEITSAFIQAEGLVLTLRDLFQVVFEMKKQEVEAAKARKSAKEDDKSKDQDKNTEKHSPEKPSAQEAPYDVSMPFCSVVVTSLPGRVLWSTHMVMLSPVHTHTLNWHI